MSRRTSHRRAATGGKGPRRGSKHDAEPEPKSKRRNSAKGVNFRETVDFPEGELLLPKKPREQRAAPKNVAARPMVVTGLVTIREDEDYGIMGVQLLADDGDLFNIVLDRRGVALGDEMDQTRAEVTGTVVAKATGKWFTVESYVERSEHETGRFEHGGSVKHDVEEELEGAE